MDGFGIGLACCHSCSYLYFRNCHIRNKRLQAKKVPQRLRDIKDVLGSYFILYLISVLIFYGLLVVRLLIVTMRLMQSMIDFAIIILIFSVLICLRFYSGHVILVWYSIELKNWDWSSLFCSLDSLLLIQYCGYNNFYEY